MTNLRSTFRHVAYRYIWKITYIPPDVMKNTILLVLTERGRGEGPTTVHRRKLWKIHHIIIILDNIWQWTLTMFETIVFYIGFFWGDTQNINFLMVIDENAACVDVNVLCIYDFNGNEKNTCFFCLWLWSSPCCFKCEFEQSFVRKKNRYCCFPILYSPPFSLSLLLALPFSFSHCF